MAKPASDGQILLFGGSGQLGLTLASTLRSLGPVRILHRADADLLDVQALRDSIRHARPSIVINAAAYTAVDRAEDGNGSQRGGAIGDG